MHGTPSSRLTIAAWQVVPPLSVTSAPARRITGTQSGFVIGATRISPPSSSRPSLGERRTRTLPDTRPGAAASPVTSAGPSSVTAIPPGRGRLGTERRDRPRLHEVHRPALDRPFRVLRRSVVVLDAPPEPGEPDHLVVGQHPRAPLGGSRSTRWSWPSAPRTISKAWMPIRVSRIVGPSLATT